MVLGVAMSVTVIASDCGFCLRITFAQVLEELAAGGAVFSQHLAIYDEIAVLEELVGILHLLEEVSVSSVIWVGALNRPAPRALEGAGCDRKPVDP